ncbi:hypothetical protein Bca52824_089506 [Brassica carinata]|uniref:DUF642 domain-containing protein n=1 Tax=Brassica carinata TaxID=52824 RepID=A0A8X7PFY4_BRACI|nr:hypothetical protein Bca52824_089506 [Brassica carinata]
MGVIVLLLLHSIFYTAFCFKDGLLPNGDFELGPHHTDMKGTQVMNKTAIPSWEVSGFVEYIPSGHKQGDMILVVPKGAFAVRLGNEASIKQKINVKKALTIPSRSVRLERAHRTSG